MCTVNKKITQTPAETCNNNIILSLLTILLLVVWTVPTV